MLVDACLYVPENREFRDFACWPRDVEKSLSWQSRYWFDLQSAV